MNQFPHIALKPPKIGTVKPASPFRRVKSSTTQAKLSDRWGHGTVLKHSASGIVVDWQQNLADRERDDMPDLPRAIPLILQIDPAQFDADKLRAYGIEVISELDDGYIIGASKDLTLKKLLNKIEKCINEEKGGNQICSVWDIADNSNLPKYILDENLLAIWDKIQDEKIYNVEVGIACVGEQSKFPEHPKRKVLESDEKYQKRVEKWNEKRISATQEWDNLKLQRENDFEEFIKHYEAEILDNIDGEIRPYSEVPDSFSCKILISGKGLKDLVFNFSYVFEVISPEEIYQDKILEKNDDFTEFNFSLEPPNANSSIVCIIDSGIQENHPLLKSAISIYDSKSWVPNETDKTSDSVRNGGHGTSVAGAVLYPRGIPTSGKSHAVCWLQNARVLDENGYLTESIFPATLIENIVNFYRNKTNTRIFNHSIASRTPCRLQYMSTWATAIDSLTWQNDILFIVAAGNLPFDQNISEGRSRKSIQHHLQNSSYPDYLLDKTCRIANPGQSFQSLTVGSVSLHTLQDLSKKSIASKDHPSAFSCTGLGIWDSIKPEVVEYGGDLVVDDGIPPTLSTPFAVCPELVRSTMNGGPPYASDQIGTSYAAPKVAHIAARLANEFPTASCLLYRAMIVQSARLPDWVKAENFNLDKAIRLMGYGIPSIDRALGGASNRITLTAEGDGENQIAARKVHIYQVTIPYELRSPGEDRDICVEITLSYKAQPRRTRRSRRKYLSTWLHWECSKKSEDPESFLERLLRDYDAPIETEKGDSMFDWTLGQQKNWGKTKELSRQAGTIQKDWTTIKSFDLRKSFCIAIVGHEGWNNDPDATIPYALAVTFEATEISVPIYAEIANVQVPIEVETEVSINL
jgi:subtilisin family serine protease